LLFLIVEWEVRPPREAQTLWSEYLQILQVNGVLRGTIYTRESVNRGYLIE
jgi:hypothetical protein